MILYYPTKFHFNTMNSFRVMDRGHSPPVQAPKKAVPDRVYNNEHVIKKPILIAVIMHENKLCLASLKCNK